MKIITTPWKNEFLELVSNSTKSIKITSPFVKENICSELLSKKRDNTQFELITSFKLPNIYSGSLDLAALNRIIDSNGTVKNFSKLQVYSPFWNVLMTIELLIANLLIPHLL